MLKVDLKMFAVKISHIYGNDGKVKSMQAAKCVDYLGTKMQQKYGINKI